MKACKLTILYPAYAKPSLYREAIWQQGCLMPPYLKGLAQISSERHMTRKHRDLGAAHY